MLAPYLPPKHEYVLFLSLTEKQIELYKHYLDNYSKRPVEGVKDRTTFLFMDFQEFQRICTHPRVLNDHSIKKTLESERRVSLFLVHRSFKLQMKLIIYYFWQALDDSDDSEGSLKDFIDDGSGSSSSSNSDSDISISDSDDSSKKKRGKKKATKARKDQQRTRVTRAAIASGDVGK